MVVEPPFGSAAHHWAGWMRIADGTPATAYTVFSKWRFDNNTREYALIHNTDGTLDFYVSGDGSASVLVESVGTVADDAWTFFACGYNPSTAISITVNDTTWTNTTSIPASLYGSGPTFRLPSQSNSGSGTSFPAVDVRFDGLALFTDYLTVDELAWLYNGGAGRTHQNLVDGDA